MSVTCSPPELFSQVAPETRSSRAIRADFKCEFSQWEIDLILHAYFQRHVLTSSPRGDAAYCCGIQSGEVEIHFDDCELLACDGGEHIDTEIERHVDGKTTGSTSISPEVSSEMSPAKGSIKLGEVNRSSETASGYTAKYTIQESLVSLMHHRHGASWIVSKAEGSGVSVEYLHRTFAFNLKLKGQRSDLRGVLTIRPGAFSVFDSRGKFVSHRFSARALILAMMAGKRLSKYFCQEYSVKFETESRS